MLDKILDMFDAILNSFMGISFFVMLPVGMYFMHIEDFDKAGVYITVWCTSYIRISIYGVMKKLGESK